MLKALWITLAALAAASPAAAAENAPGTLISSTAVPTPQAGMKAWSIAYWTTDAQNRPLQATGMVVAPAAPPSGRSRDVVAWTHGTWGVAESCAPSQSAMFWTLTPGLPQLTAANDVIVAPDYPGLGTDSPHPYLLGVPTARSVLDAIRAARTLPGTGAGSRFAVWGESQGGHAALWTGQQARSYAPELTLVGVAAAAPPTDLQSNFRLAADPAIKAYLTGLATYAWSNYYNFPLKIGGPATPGIIRRMAQTCIAGAGKPKIGTLLGMLALRQGLRNFDVTTQQPWAGIAAGNSPAASSAVPVMFAQTVSDPLVAPAVTRGFAKRMCTAGVAVHWVDIPGGDHPKTAAQSADETARWLADRFAGRKAASDCGAF